MKRGLDHNRSHARPTEIDEQGQLKELSKVDCQGDAGEQDHWNHRSQSDAYYPQATNEEYRESDVEQPLNEGKESDDAVFAEPEQNSMRRHLHEVCQHCNGQDDQNGVAFRIAGSHPQCYEGTPKRQEDGADRECYQEHISGTYRQKASDPLVVIPG